MVNAETVIYTGLVRQNGIPRSVWVENILCLALGVQIVESVVISLGCRSREPCLPLYSLRAEFLVGYNRRVILGL
jgi:hypothetical protein